MNEREMVRSTGALLAAGALPSVGATAAVARFREGENGRPAHRGPPRSRSASRSVATGLRTCTAASTRRADPGAVRHGLVRRNERPGAARPRALLAARVRLSARAGRAESAPALSSPHRGERLHFVWHRGNGRGSRSRSCCSTVGRVPFLSTRRRPPCSCRAVPASRASTSWSHRSPATCSPMRRSGQAYTRVASPSACTRSRGASGTRATAWPPATGAPSSRGTWRRRVPRP